MFPTRVSIVTCNLWGMNRWKERQPVISEFLSAFKPDIFSVQELTDLSRGFLDNVLSSHDRVDDSFCGWITEGNIYWNRVLFDLVEYGIEDIGLLEEDRRLFWVRLKVRATSKSILVSTAHFTYKAHPNEIETGQSPRLKQSRLTVSALDRLSMGIEPTFFMGDLNDSSHPVFILNDAGYVDCFSALGVSSAPTAPCYPTVDVTIGRPRLSQTLDWVFSNKFARALSAQVPNFYYRGMTPSDHWPVQAIYEI